MLIPTLFPSKRTDAVGVLIFEVHVIPHTFRLELSFVILCSMV